MTLTITPTLDDIYTGLRAFVLSVLPAGVPVIELPVDRVAMPPPVPGFVGMSASIGKRIMTNLDQWDPEAVAPTEITIEQAVELSVKLDCYGAASNDWAMILSTVLRDEYGVDALAPSMVPLYTDSPRHAPLTNDELQYENRWLVLASLQYNPVVRTPMEFADTAAIDLINVDIEYPP